MMQTENRDRKLVEQAFLRDLSDKERARLEEVMLWPG